jgi:hypothetical protein
MEARFGVGAAGQQPYCLTFPVQSSRQVRGLLANLALHLDILSKLHSFASSQGHLPCHAAGKTHFFEYGAIAKVWKNIS